MKRLLPIVILSFLVGLSYQKSWAYTTSSFVCDVPTDINIMETTSSSAKVSWNSSGSLWRIEYGTVGFTQGTGTEMLPEALEVNIKNLNAITEYEFYIANDCGASGMSEWLGPFSFYTKDPPPKCNGIFYDNGGSLFSYNNAITNETITLCPSTAGEVLTVSFTSFELENNGDNCYDELMIFNGDDVTDPVIPSPNGTTKGWCWDKQAGSEGGSGNLEGLSLTSTNETGCLTFVFNSDGLIARDGWAASVSCSLPPACPSPAGLNVESVTSSTAEISWLSGNGDNLFSTMVEWGPLGFMNGNGEEVNIASNTFTITNLWPSTTYQFYVRDDCNMDGKSAWVGPYTFTTSCAAFEGDSFADPIVVNSLPFSTEMNTADCFTNQIGYNAADAFFTFTTSSCADSVVFSTCSDDTDFDTFIRLLDADGNEIATNDDAAEGCEHLLNGSIRFSTMVQNVEPNTVYTAVVEGYNGYTGNFNIELSEINIIDSISVFALVNDVTCNGETDGSIAVSVEGGIAPLTFTWNNGDTIADPNDLEKGMYEIIIQDACGQTVTDTFEIAEPEQFEVVTTSSDETLSGENDGSANSMPTGGTAPYTYLWSNDSTTQNIDSLAVGQYCVTVSDAVGCTAEMCDLVLAGPTSTNEIEDLSKMKLSPNPASENVLLEIEFAEIKDIQIAIFSTTGQLIFETKKEKIQAGLIELNVSDYPSGVYFVKLSADGQRTTRRLVVN